MLADRGAHHICDRPIFYVGHRRQRFRLFHGKPDGHCARLFHVPIVIARTVLVNCLGIVVAWCHFMGVSMDQILDDELRKFEERQRKELEEFQARQRAELEAFEAREIYELRELEEELEREVQIRIDRVDYLVKKRVLTGDEIRQIPKPPIGPDRDVFEVALGGSDRKIEGQQKVEIRDGLRFFTAPAHINPGSH